MEVEILTYSGPTVPENLCTQLLSFYEPHRPPVAHDQRLRPVSMFLLVNSKLVAALDILSKSIIHNGERFAASGLSRVIVAPGDRRKGFGSRLVTAARDFMSSSGVDLSVFTCDDPLQTFYERCGWQILPSAVVIGGTVEQPLFSDELSKVTLGRFFTPKAKLHANAFRRCHIALYPGEIDKLW